MFKIAARGYDPVMDLPPIRTVDLSAERCATAGRTPTLPRGPRVRRGLTGDVRIDWSENTYDSVATASDFERNFIRFRAEARFGVAVPRPAGFVSITIA